MNKFNNIFFLQELKDMIDISKLEEVYVEHDGEGIEITKKSNQWFIRYSKQSELIRALGLVIENFDEIDGFVYSETPAFDTLSVMVDCSRNAVITVNAFKKLVRHLALMGYNAIQLYTEDIFELKNYPSFGYMRGRYTQAEFREMDAYAQRFGIELIPCIQTLAHLEQALRWSELNNIVDCNDILLVGEEKTYKFIDDMLKTMSDSIKSRRINIGMDEAFMLGLGNYLEKNGYHDRFDIILHHLHRVIKLCKKYDYQPMMWSDMFFKDSYAGGHCVNDNFAPEKVIDLVPKEVSLVYWDYFLDDEKKYDSMLKSHLQFNNKIIFAGGAWKWHGFTPGNELSFEVGKAAATSCKKNGIKDIIITSWGDNGGEGSIFSVLPAFQFWAESCYYDGDVMEVIDSRFKTCVNAKLEDFLKLDTPLFTEDNPKPGKIGLNPPKYMLYQDILCGIADKNIEGRNYNKHFEETIQILEQVSNNSSEWKYLFDTQISLCKLLAIKSELGIEIKEKYNKRDKEGLEKIAKEVLPNLIILLNNFQEAYRKQWLKENKVFGLDCFDIRTGGLRERLKVATQRILDYTKGESPNIEELDIEKLYFDNKRCDISTLAMVKWNRLSTFSCITGI